MYGMWIIYFIRKEKESITLRFYRTKKVILPEEVGEGFPEEAPDLHVKGHGAFLWKRGMTSFRDTEGRMRKPSSVGLVAVGSKWGDRLQEMGSRPDLAPARGPCWGVWTLFYTGIGKYMALDTTFPVCLADVSIMPLSRCLLSSGVDSISVSMQSSHSPRAPNRRNR